MSTTSAGFGPRRNLALTGMCTLRH
jgi:hypothetical protein